MNGLMELVGGWLVHAYWNVLLGSCLAGVRERLKLSLTDAFSLVGVMSSPKYTRWTGRLGPATR